MYMSKVVGVVLASVLLAASAHGTTMRITGEVSRLLATEDTKWGGCMVSLNVSPMDSGLDCPTHLWVTLSCTGEHTSRSAALRMYDLAQMAFVTGNRIHIWVDDTRKHNGACFASRIDVLPD